MPTTAADVLGATDYAWARLRHRLIGLTDDEWAWSPTDGADDADLGLQWRLAQLADLLRDNRNAQWLGRAPGNVEVKPADDATAAVAQLEASYAEWRGHLSAMDDAGLRERVGAVARADAGSTRLAFALHVLDELTHRGAEIGLVRDLCARRPLSGP